MWYIDVIYFLTMCIKIYSFIFFDILIISIYCTYLIYLSNAQQSCVAATAPRTHVIKQQNDGDAMKKIDEQISNTNPKSIKHGLNIDQKSPEIEVWRRLGGVLEASWGVLGRLGSILGVLGI